MGQSSGVPETVTRKWAPIIEVMYVLSKYSSQIYGSGKESF